ncbi:MAG: hypothetical protein FWE13_02775 [Firmicutes bacterium]|nr:hypothetical protein [Bacillota bacterium]
MKKKILGIAVAIVMLLAVVGLAACELNNPSLAEYRATAITVLEDYATSKGVANYTPENWLVLQGHVEIGRTNINAAGSKPAVRIARDTAKAAVRAVESKDDTEMAEILSHFDLTDPKEIWNGTIEDLLNGGPYGVGAPLGIFQIRFRKAFAFPEFKYRHFRIENVVGISYSRVDELRQVAWVFLRGYWNPGMHFNSKTLYEAIRHFESLEFIKQVIPMFPSPGFHDHFLVNRPDFDIVWPKL